MRSVGIDCDNMINILPESTTLVVVGDSHCRAGLRMEDPWHAVRNDLTCCGDLIATRDGITRIRTLMDGDIRYPGVLYHPVDVQVSLCFTPWIYCLLAKRGTSKLFNIINQVI